MLAEEVIGRAGIYTATFVFASLSAVVPLVNAELFVLGIASTVSKPLLIPIALVAAAGQMVGKTIIFQTGRGLFGRTGLKDKVEALGPIFARRPRLGDLLVFVSALTGLPPLYAVSVAAGGLRLSLLRFVTAGFIGRSMRFGAVALIPRAVIGGLG